MMLPFIATSGAVLIARATGIDDFGGAHVHQCVDERALQRSFVAAAPPVFLLPRTGYSARSASDANRCQADDHRSGWGG